MLTTIVLPAVIGLLWGVLVSLFNDYWTRKALHNPSNKAATVFFLLRQGINIMAMFLVYKNTAMLIGTALGLIAVKNYILFSGIKEIRSNKRKG